MLGTLLRAVCSTIDGSLYFFSYNKISNILKTSNIQYNVSDVKIPHSHLFLWLSSEPFKIYFVIEIFVQVKFHLEAPYKKTIGGRKVCVLDHYKGLQQISRTGIIKTIISEEKVIVFEIYRQ